MPLQYMQVPGEILGVGWMLIGEIKECIEGISEQSQHMLLIRREGGMLIGGLADLHLAAQVVHEPGLVTSGAPC